MGGAQDPPIVGGRRPSVLQGRTGTGKIDERERERKEYQENRCTCVVVTGEGDRSKERVSGGWCPVLGGQDRSEERQWRGPVSFFASRKNRRRSSTGGAKVAALIVSAEERVRGDEDGSRLDAGMDRRESA